MGRSFPAAAAVLALLAPESAALAGPAVASRWQQVTVSQDECLRRAEDAIRRTGFTQLERTQQSRYGTLDEYTAAIRCIVSNRLAIFIVSGPSRTQSDRMAGTLLESWR